MMLTSDTLQSALIKAPRPWIMECIKQLPPAGINTTHEISSFLAQVAHESDEFTHLTENLNYSAARLPQVWSRFAQNPTAIPAQRVPNDLAYKYQRNPEALANYVYSSLTSVGRRLGNGDEASGDGWRHRGVGPIQITGKINQTLCSVALDIPMSMFHDELMKPYNGIRSAIWFWKTRWLDNFDDDEDVRAETRRINGGETGLAMRQAYFNRIMEAIE